MKKTILSIVLFLGVLAPTASLLGQDRPCAVINCDEGFTFSHRTCQCELVRGRTRPKRDRPCEVKNCTEGFTFSHKTCECELVRGRIRPRPPR